MKTGANMKFERQHHIHVGSFEADVLVAVTKEERKRFDIPEGALGYVEMRDNMFLMALPVRWDEGTVWHEAHHLARFLNHYHGIITTWDDHEADAYLQEYIVRLIKKHIYNRKA